MICTEEAAQIDRRSFHSFEMNGDFLLFDRGLGALLVVDSTIHAFLSLLEAGYDEDAACAIIDRNDTAFGSQSILRSLRSLIPQGFFRWEGVNPVEQDRLVRALWRHNPRRVQLLMAQGCNLGCRYCYAWRNGSNQKGTLMPWEIAKRAVDFLIERSGPRRDLQVTFFGGEPLLNLPVIRKLVEYCREIEKQTSKRFVFELITNGTLLAPEITDWIVGQKFVLFVSLDGWKEMHNDNRPSMSGEDMYDVIQRNALYANEQYLKHGLPPMKIRANLTNRHHDWKAVGEYLATLGFKVIGVGAIEPLPHGDSSPSAMTEDQMDELHEESTRYLVDSLNRLIAGEALTYFEALQLKKATTVLKPRALKGITCGVARNTQVVDNKGNIFPCHRYEGMQNYVIGNVFSGLDREKTLAYYLKVNRNATDRCHSCWIRDYCAGGCAWLLSKNDGHLADPTERECDRRRKSMERALWLRQKMRAHFPERFKRDGEIDLDSWDWGPGNEYNDADGEMTAGAAIAEAKGSCGSGSCETCGPGGCAD